MNDLLRNWLSRHALTALYMEAMSAKTVASFQFKKMLRKGFLELAVF
jgi:hypothetical protein